MDMLRSCYRTKMKLFRDSAEMYWVRWYWAPPGAETYPHYHKFASLNWSEGERKSPYIGEEDRTNRVWDNGKQVMPVRGLHTCEEKAELIDGSTAAELDDPPRYNSWGVSNCCMETNGGLRFGGSAEITLGSCCPNGHTEKFKVIVEGFMGGIGACESYNGEFILEPIYHCAWGGVGPGIGQYAELWLLADNKFLNIFREGSGTPPLVMKPVGEFDCQGVNVMEHYYPEPISWCGEVGTVIVLPFGMEPPPPPPPPHPCSHCGNNVLVNMVISPEGFDGDLVDLNGECVLSFVGDCRWLGTNSSGKGWELVFNEFEGQWELIGTQSEIFNVHYYGGSFNCGSGGEFGPGFASSEGLTFPEYVSVSATP